MNDFNKKLEFDFARDGVIIRAMYRPFTKQHLYLSKPFNEMLCQMPQIYPATLPENAKIVDENNAEIKCDESFVRENGYLPNLTICMNGVSANTFSAVMLNAISDFMVQFNSQCFPLYHYEKLDSSVLAQNLLNTMNLNEGATYFRRKSAIRDEALSAFQAAYNDEKISKEAIFYYIYALLNHPFYATKYKDNLTKMLPRIPFMRDFWAFEKAGRNLAHLHLNYESFARESRAKAVLTKDEREGLFAENIDIFKELNDEDFTLKKMRFKNKEKSEIIFNDKISITQIPQIAHKYLVNGKSAIEWIIDRYQVKSDKDSGILNNPNLFECEGGALNGEKGGKYALKLLLSVIEMSARTMEILDSMPKYEVLENA